MRAPHFPLIRAALRPALACSAATALGLAALGSAGFFALPAAAGPTGGEVRGGEARIVTRGNVTIIRQGSERVVIDWSSFDIDANDVVRFLQPGGNAVALNRILSGMPSHIRGKLTANGNVWLVNPSGVMFHAGSVIDVGGLIATSADIGNAAFMAGSGAFDKPGEPGAQVINEGRITFAEAGLVGLVAPHAENRGTIRGKLGKIVIAGQESLSVDLSGEGLFEIDLRDAAKIEGAHAGNSGVILAEGGTVVISAAAARDAVEAAVSVSGVIVASSARVEGGTIVLDGGAGGVEVSGRLAATSDVAGGGAIDVSGARIRLTETARLDVSGETGGGRVRIGGDIAAIKSGTAPAMAEARRTEIAAGARIRADALGAGQGGEVAAWSSEATVANGAISARGGRLGGDGGFVELSSRLGLGFAGTVDLSAADGRTGLLLLDPRDVIIQTGGAPITGDVDGGDGALTLVLDPAALAASHADIRIEATRDIDVRSAVTMREADASLTLAAGRNILLKANFDIAGDLSLIADAEVQLSDGPLVGDGIGRIILSGDIDLRVPTGRLVLSTPQGIDGSAMSAGARLRLVSGESLDLPETSLAGGLEIDVAGDVTLNGLTAASLDIVAQATTTYGTFFAGDIGQTAAVTVAGTTHLETPGDVTLDLGNDFGGAVTVQAANASLRDVNFLEIRDSDLSGDLIAAAGTAAETVLIGGRASLAALLLDGVDVGSGAGALTLTTVEGGVALTGIRAGATRIAAAGGGAVAGDVQAGSIWTRDLRIAASGAAALGGILLEDARIDGALTLSDATDVTLLGVTANAEAGIDLGAVPGLLTLERVRIFGDAAIHVDGDIDLALVETLAGDATAGSLTLSAGGDLRQRRSDAIALAAAGEGAGAFALRLSADETVLVSAAHAGAYARLLATAGDLDLSASGDLLLPGIASPSDLRIAVGGETRLAANGALVADFVGDVTLAGLDAGAGATLRVEGALGQSGAAVVDGRLDLLVTDTVTLTDAGNDFATVAGSLGSASATLVDADGFTVADFRGDGLSARSLAGDVTLRDVALTGALGAEGDRLTLSRVSAAGGATLTARTGDLVARDFAAGAPASVVAAGGATLKRVALDALSVEATGDVSLTDAGAAGVVLTSATGAVSVANLRAASLDATAGTGISAAGVLAGAIALDARNGSATLGGVVSTGALRVSASGDVLSLADGPSAMDAVTVAGARAARIGQPVDALLGDAAQDRIVADLTAVSARTLAAEALTSLVRADGDAAFVAGGDISIRSGAPSTGGLLNRFAGTLALSSGGSATVEAAGAVTLAASAIASDLSLRANAGGETTAGGAPGIGQVGDVSVGGTARFVTGAGATPPDAQRGDVALSRAGNAFGTVTAVAGALTLRDADGFSLIGADLAGRLRVGSAGAAQEGDVILANVAAQGGASVRVAGGLDLSDLALGAASRLEAGGALTATRIAAGATALSAGAGLTASNLDTGPLVVSAGDALSLTDVISTGDATLASGGALSASRLTATGAVSAASGAAMTLSTLDAASLSARSGGALAADAIRFATATLAAADAATLTGLSGGDLALTARSVSLTASNLGETTVSSRSDLVASDLSFASLILDADRDVTLKRLSGGRLEAASGGATTVGTAVLHTVDLSAATLDLREVATTGSLAAEAGGVLSAADIVVGGDARLIAGGALTAARLAIGGALALEAAGDLSVVDATFETAAADTRGDATLARLAGSTLTLSADGDATAAALDLDRADLRAGGALSLVDSRLGDFELVAGAALDLSDTDLGTGAATAGAGADLRDVSAVDLALIAEGDISAEDLSGGAISLTSASGDIGVLRASLPTGRLDLLAAGTLDLAEARFATATLEAGGDLSLSKLTGGVATARSGGMLDASDLDLVAADFTAGAGATLARIETDALTLVAGGDATVKALDFGTATLSAGGALSLTTLEGGRLTASAHQLEATGLTATRADLGSVGETVLSGATVGALTLAAGGDASASDVEFGTGRLSADGTLALSGLDGRALIASAGRTMTATDIVAARAEFTAGAGATLARIAAGTLDLTTAGDGAVSGTTFGRADLAAAGALTLRNLDGDALDAASARLDAADIRAGRAGFATTGDARLARIAATTLDLSAGRDADVSATRFTEARLSAGRALALAELDGEGLDAQAGAGGLSGTRLDVDRLDIGSAGAVALDTIAAQTLALTGGGDARVGTSSLGEAVIDVAGDLALVDLRATRVEAVAGGAVSVATSVIATLDAEAGRALSVVGGALDQATLVSGGDLSATGARGADWAIEAGGMAILNDLALTRLSARSGGAMRVADLTAGTATLAAEGSARLDRVRVDTLGLETGAGASGAALTAGRATVRAGTTLSLSDVAFDTADLGAGEDLTVSVGAGRDWTVAAGADMTLDDIATGALTADAGRGLVIADLDADAVALTAGAAAQLDRVTAVSLTLDAGAGIGGADLTADTARIEAGAGLAISNATLGAAELIATGAISVEAAQGGAWQAVSGAGMTLTDAALDRLNAIVGGALAVTDLTADSAGFDVAGAASLTRMSATTLGLDAGGAVQGVALDADEASLAAGAGLGLNNVRFGTAALQSGGDLTVADAAGTDWTTVSDAATRLSRIRLDALDAQTTGAMTVADAHIDAAALTSGGAARIDRLEAGRLDLVAGGALTGGDIAVGSGALAARDITLARLAADDGLRIDGARVVLEDLSAGRLEISAAVRGLALDRVRVTGDAALTSGGALALSRGRIGGALTVAASGAGRVSDVTAATAAFDATGRLDLAHVATDGDLTARARGGDLTLGPIAVGGALRARAGAGDILSRDGAAITEAYAVAAPGAAAIPGEASPSAAEAAAPTQSFAELIRVEGAAWFDASGAVLLPAGATLGNDFRSGVSVFAGDVVALSDVNDLIIGAGAATLPGRGATTRTGINGFDEAAPASVRIDAGGAVTEAAGARIVSAGDLLVTAGGDIMLGSAHNRIAGAAGLVGANVTLANIGDLTLGPIRARGDLTILAGAEGAPAAVTQTARVDTVSLTMTEGLAARGTATRTGALDIRGDAAFSTGAPAGRTAEDLGKGLILNREDNVFGGAVSAQRFFGDVLIVEEATADTIGRDSVDGGVLTIGALEAAGNITIRTSDDLVLAGRMTALTDDMAGERMDAPGPATDADWRAQGAAGIAESDLHLFIADGKLLTLDATAGGADAAGGMIRIDRAVDGANALSTARDPAAVAARGGAGSISLDAGAKGDVRARDWLGAAGPLGEIRVIEAMDVSFGQTFAGRDADPGEDRNRFLMGGSGEARDVITASGLVVDAHGEVAIHAPAGLVSVWENADDYYGLNVAYVTYGRNIKPSGLSLYGFIGESGQKAAGLFPVGPEGSQFKTNGCVVGDVQDCTGVSQPRVLTLVRLQPAQILSVDEDDLLELFVSYGNEELWGIPQNSFSDVDLARAREEASRQATGDQAAAPPSTEQRPGR